METAILVLRLITPSGPEHFERTFETKAECIEAQEEWVELITSIDPVHFHLGYAACIKDKANEKEG